MPRDARAFLSDILESCDAIAAAVRGLDVAAYRSGAGRLDVPSQRVFMEARLLRTGPQLKAGLGVRVGPGAGA